MSRSSDKARAEFTAMATAFSTCPSLGNFARLRSAAGALMGTAGHDGCDDKCEVAPAADIVTAWVCPTCRHHHLDGVTR